MLNRADHDLALRFKERLLWDGVPVVSATVFGSRARGDHDPESDLDILVLVDRIDASIRRAVSHAAWEVGIDAGVLIQAIVLSRDVAEQGPERSSLLMLAVREDGVPV